MLKNEKIDLPDEFILPNPYNLPVHEQGSENNCTSHAAAGMLEYHLSAILQERSIINVEDLWHKQKTLGTATNDGDYLDGPLKIATKYGVKFTTESGRKGVYFLGGQIIFEN